MSSKNANSRWHAIVGGVIFAALCIPGRVGAQTYSYDGLNRLTSATYHDGTTIVYTYDAAGNRLRLSVSGGCGFGLSAGSATYSASGGSGSVNVITAAGCPWTAASNDSFLTVTSPTGTGSATVNFTVASGGAARAGTIVVGGQTFAITQAAPAVATLTSPSQGSVLASNTIRFTWTAGDAPQYMLFLGTAPGASDVGHYLISAAQTVTATNVPINGHVVFARLWSLLSTGWDFRDYTFATVNTTGGLLTSPVQGTMLSARSVLFTWTPGNATQFILDVGSAPGAGDFAQTTASSALSASVTGIPAAGQPVYARLWSLLPSGWSSVDYTFDTANVAGAVLATPAIGELLTERSVQFSWTAGGGSAFQLYLGTSPGGTDLGEFQTGSLSAIATNLPTNGQPVYVRLWSLLASGWTSVDYSFNTVAASGAVLTSPAQAALLSANSIQFSWTAGNASQYLLYLGSSPGTSDLALLPAGGSQSVTATGLSLSGQTVYARLWSLLPSGWSFVDSTFVSLNTTAAVLTSPAQGATFTQASVEFDWTAGTASQYQLYLGTTPGAFDISRMSVGNSLSATVTNVPTNGQAIYARLWSLLSDGWASVDYAFNTTSAIGPVMTSPAQGAALASATTFNWTAGGGSQYEFYLGTSLGAADLGRIQTGTARSATVTGLPRNGATLYARVWYLLPGGWTFTDTTFAAENVSVLTSPTSGALLAPGAVSFTWTKGSASQYELYLGSSPGNNDLGRVLAGTMLSTTVSSLPATGQALYARLWSLMPTSGWSSVDYTFATVTMPLMTVPAANTTLSENAVQFNWTAGSASRYQLFLGSSPGANDIGRLPASTSLTGTVTGLPMRGQPVFAHLWALFPTGWAAVDYPFATMNTAAAVLTSPAQGETLAAQAVRFNWTPGQASQYELYLGTSPGLADLARLQTGTALTALATGLSTKGQTIYARLWSLLPTGWTPIDYTFSTVNTDGAVLTSPAQDTALIERSVQFSWTPGHASQYQLYVGSTPGASDVALVMAGTNLTATVTNLPVDGRTIYVRLWSLLSGGWSPVDYRFNTIDATGAALTSPAQGTPLAASAVQFTWSAGAASQYELYLGSAVGAADLGRVLAGASLSATVSGLPTDGRTIYVRLWALLPAGWTPVDYTFDTLAEAGAVLTSPAQGATITNGSARFTWTPGSGSQFQIYVGTTLGASDLAHVQTGSQLSATITGLPTSGGIIYVRLWSLLPSGWVSVDYAYLPG